MEEIRILAYLRGRLSPAERESFESEIESNPELAAQLKVQEKLIKALRNENYKPLLKETQEYSAISPTIKALKEKLETVQSNADSAMALLPKKSQPTVLRRLVPWLSAAAAVIIIFFTGSIFISLYNLKSIAIQNSPSLNFDKKAGIEEDALNLNQALDSIKVNNFKGAINHLLLINEQSELYITAQYLLGYSNIKLEKFKIALSYFNQLEGKEDQLDMTLSPNFESVDKKQVEWLKALCLLGSGKKKQALIIIDKIILDSEHPYHEEALNIKNAF